MKAINVRGVRNGAKASGGSLLFTVALDNGAKIDVFFATGRVRERPMVTNNDSNTKMSSAARNEALKAVALHVWK